MKNRAGLLALVVLAVATIFMVFVVLPKINGGKNPVADLANQASSTVKDVAKSAGDAASDVVKSANDVAASGQSAVLAKMDRLKVDATGAVAEMQTLFADGKVPTADQIAATKTKAETALKAIVDMPLPEGLDATMAAAAKATTETASKWLGLVQAIPTDVDGAKKAIGELAVAMGLPALAEVAKTTEPTAPAAEPAKPADAATTTAEAAKPADAAPAADAKPAADTTKPADTAAAPAANGIVPTFDIVRVEKDGSMVVAGRAAPNSKIQIMNGDTVIASTDADQDGNFVAVLDNPLAPGDYSLVLKTTDKNGVVNLSEEVATVSVPKDKTGQLLAMVTKAGEASRILTAPEAPKTAEVAAATPAAPAAGDVKVPDLPAASNTIAGSAPVVDVPAASASAETKPAADATTTPAAPAQEAKPAAPTTPDVMVTAVELEGQKIFIAGTTKPGMLVRAYADDKLVGEIKSEANGAFVVEGKLDLAVGSHTIRADVIDDKGAVAFRATVPFDRPEGEAVAVVASNDAPAGAPAKMENLGDGKFDQLRAEAGKAMDLLKGLFAGGKLPTGEQLAAGRSSLQFALASLADFKLPDGSDAASSTLVSKVASSAANALNLLKALPQDPAAFNAGFAAVETAVNAVISPNSDASASASAAATTPAAETTTVAAAEPAKPASTEAAKAATTEPAKSATTEPATTPAADATPAADTAPAAADATKPAATQEAVKPATSSSAEAVKPAGEPKTTEQAPLQASKTSVIIRHGDTLWQISRRVYGRGIRYTTIYLANEDQITNPDKIAPGQVFGVPDKSVPDSDAEALHRKHLQEKK